MGSVASWLFIFGSGILQAFGNSMNAQLRTSLQNPWLTSIVSFSLIICVFVPLFAMFPKPLPAAADLSAMPWWAPLGGVVGAFAVFAGLLLVDKVGAGTLNGLVITANILASLAIDHFGLLRMPVHALSPGRIVGGVLMVVGIALISYF